ncbi:6-hydroxymethylpterin diphosphokinase MptE-like protein [Candidatus Nitrosocosmicus franklandus]|uniref:6-hydroxymethyl-7,8-dihydropterin pyrophosphokinase n=1 Tax=Candidatus Nitrosocosmicus franklandianus TaxID=1798806 RepID=A0A484I7C8_9ARCH|nr:6-hydroxymethylpterin diphosphokinase MptE-like protein [Candidatus Nitrosocosmicus franklandus]VFJ13071.1 6-hydroxymethyl-7,8-dihydropterin pyrophosphokinase [Candidatus Nitrosocosmicus franklandus]
MRFSYWYRHYQIIAKYLDLRIDKDFLSSIYLSQHLGNINTNLHYFSKICQSKVMAIGAGPSIEDKQIQQFILDVYQKFSPKNNQSKETNLVVMVADGASELILDLEIIPDFVITDLDGNFESLLKASKKGSVMVIHAHGDNIEKINSSISDFDKIVGTTQNFPLTNVFNFGGFTDGDRCVFLADHFLAKEIILIGMDFDSRIGHFSKRKIMNYDFKRKKLDVAKNLIKLLTRWTNSEMTQISSSNYPSPIYGVDRNIIL